MLKKFEVDENGLYGQTKTSEICSLVYIYDDEPLGFEKDPTISTMKMQAQDPLEEVDLRDGEVKRPLYISAKVNPDLK